MTMTNLMTQIVISISEVMETMFYIPVEPRDGYITIGESELFADVSGILKYSNRNNSISGSDTIHAAIITFHGNFSGTISLIVPENLLMIMTENFMGEKRENLTSDHLEGTLKETLNMLAGNTFSKVDSELSFCLGVPEIYTSSLINSTKKGGAYFNNPLLVIDTMDGAMGVTVNIE
ncbi:MAG: chemotaxis protein CheX [Desulfamplus sp.]|nr:chemotaxis protein CheX [Desulfamplus sp.]